MRSVSMKRRTFLGGVVTAIALGNDQQQAASAAQPSVAPPMPEPLVWPVVTKRPPGIRAFAGHTDTVPDIVGRIGTPASLVIFTEGNHLMVLLSDDIVGAFPSWAKSQPHYADLDVDNIVVVTLPQPDVRFLPGHRHGRTGALARVAEIRRDRAAGAVLFEESRSGAARAQRQPPRDSWPRRCHTDRRTDRAPGSAGRTGSSGTVSRGRRRADRNVRRRRGLRRGSSQLSGPPRHRASRSS